MDAFPLRFTAHKKKSEVHHALCSSLTSMLRPMLAVTTLSKLAPSPSPSPDNSQVWAVGTPLSVGVSGYNRVLNSSFGNAAASTPTLAQRVGHGGIVPTPWRSDESTTAYWHQSLNQLRSELSVWLKSDYGKHSTSGHPLYTAILCLCDADELGAHFGSLTATLRKMMKDRRSATSAVSFDCLCMLVYAYTCRQLHTQQQSQSQNGFETFDALALPRDVQRRSSMTSITSEALGDMVSYIKSLDGASSGNAGSGGNTATGHANANANRREHLEPFIKACLVLSLVDLKLLLQNVVLPLLNNGDNANSVFSDSVLCGMVILYRVLLQTDEQLQEQDQRRQWSAEATVADDDAAMSSWCPWQERGGGAADGTDLVDVHDELYSPGATDDVMICSSCCCHAVADGECMCDCHGKFRVCGDQHHWPNVRDMSGKLRRAMLTPISTQAGRMMSALAPALRKHLSVIANCCHNQHGTQLDLNAHRNASATRRPNETARTRASGGGSGGDATSSGISEAVSGAADDDMLVQRKTSFSLLLLVLKVVPVFIGPQTPENHSEKKGMRSSSATSTDGSGGSGGDVSGILLFDALPTYLTSRYLNLRACSRFCLMSFVGDNHETSRRGYGSTCIVNVCKLACVVSRDESAGVGNVHELTDFVILLLGIAERVHSNDDRLVPTDQGDEDEGDRIESILSEDVLEEVECLGLVLLCHHDAHVRLKGLSLLDIARCYHETYLSSEMTGKDSPGVLSANSNDVADVAWLPFVIHLNQQTPLIRVGEAIASSSS